MLQQGNKQVPVKSNSGYKFYSIDKFRAYRLNSATGGLDDNGDKYSFLPEFEPNAHEAIKAGSSVTGVSVVVRVKWGTENKKVQDFIYSDELVNGVINSYGAKAEGKYGSNFSITINNVTAYENLTMEAIIVSDTGVEIPVSAYK